MKQSPPESDNGMSFANNGEPAKISLIQFPFKSYLSLKPLIETWKRTEASDDPLKAALAPKVREALRQAPELSGTITDLTVLDKHRPLLALLMSTIFPAAYRDEVAAAALVPFKLQPVYATPTFERLMLVQEGSFTQGVGLTASMQIWTRTMNAYKHILAKFYGVTLDFEYPLLFTSTDEKTGLERHYKILIDLRFIDVLKVGETKQLGAEEIKTLLAHSHDMSVWFELIPPECFEFHGFAVFHAIDVTDQEVLSALKNDLLKKDALTSAPQFQSLQHKLRVLLKRPAVKMGLAGIPGAQNLMQEHGRELGQSFILNDRCRQKCASVEGSIYHQAFQTGESFVVEDLAARPALTPVEQEIVQQGVRNLFIAPLYYEDQLMGLLELGSPNPGDINALNSFKLKEVLALFSIAVKRSLDEMTDRVEAVIKEQCTAIHPAVEWRFRQAALKYLQHRRAGVVAEMEAIIFKDVFPLYGVSDIRGSSTRRNDAIRGDLIEQLQLARNLIRAAHEHKPMPFLRKLEFSLNQQLAKLEKGLSSDDGVSILEFLRRDVETHFEQLQSFNREVSESIAAYRAAIDPGLGGIYRRRKDFDLSVMQLNETISKYIEDEQVKAQEVFPHYFEKYKSDGVEHGMYIGAALVENGKYDQLYLKNLRLWQLQLMCEVARFVEKEKANLKVPLEMAHLILVQNLSLAIRFRYDEKKFDVDGAYNVRYEILKKRIDKAVIKGKQERLTQPGKVAIVYSHTREAQEYKEYIEFLQAAGYLHGLVEDVELEDLQGVHGLKALRVTVEMPSATSKLPLAAQEENGKSRVNALAFA
ncbi:MAG: GAF domain-containing protein [candidate division KSB1 bacterium]